MPEALLISNLLLWVVVVIMAVIIFALARQVGVLYERIAPAGALMINSRLKAGMPAPEMEVADLQGVRHKIGGSNANGRGTLLFFVAPTCPICKSLLPVVASIGRSEGDWLDIILGSDGAEADHQSFIAGNGVAGLPYVVSEAMGRAFGVSRLPYAVLIEEHGAISSMGIVNSREHLESLFESRERGVASIQEYLARRGDGAP